ncbi:imidazole glycerol phosphate synthase subunit HisH [Litorihabitans aurantiacus]|uniref:Imidazole glycerol phosphate synthase subunit HisH n=1 Tax=Litorihabitans aurantiacus TaxID=1930061 RepID=A0AA38CR52_9MICO|nr:imidazole glycerol phosphate synthase subunit HisH [Litorihabitans aurantiacus]GMA31691.1 imidazole glycerol phosphate synthase subunit HisH [Litorihabitans aurantiacus]
MTDARPAVVVLDYGSGNTHSAVRALERAGADVTLTADPAAVAAADGLVVPGVGAFAAVMEQLLAVGGDRMIDRRLAGGRPVLGICVGLQVLFTAGTEHGTRTAGLDQWPGEVVPLEAEIVPHMGWSAVRPPADTVLFRGVEDERFYFVHSYGVGVDPAEILAEAGDTPLVPPRVTWAEHGRPFVAAVENGPLSATQFHPEKSGDAGARLLRNWVDSLTA